MKLNAVWSQGIGASFAALCAVIGSPLHRHTGTTKVVKIYSHKGNQGQKGVTCYWFVAGGVTG
jgi:hypothetical protein